MWLIWLEGGPHNSLYSGQTFTVPDKSVLRVLSFRVVPLWAHILADKERNCKYIQTNSVLPMFSGLRGPEICSLSVSSINQPWKFRAVTWSPGAVPPSVCSAIRCAQPPIQGHILWAKYGWYSLHRFIWSQVIWPWTKWNADRVVYRVLSMGV